MPWACSPPLGALAQDADHHPDVDWRYDPLFVALTSHDAGGKVTARDADMARAVSAAAQDAGAVAQPGRMRSVEIAMDSADFSQVAPIWAAALGYELRESNELLDPAGRLPAIWCQQTQTPNANRFHFDIYVPGSEVAAVLRAAEEAGATLDRSNAPDFVVVTDPQGNRLCICASEGREV